MMTQPYSETVGILIPTLNRKAYLAEALHSSRSQTYNDVEIIVIDNGSTDGTAEFMKTIPDTRLHYVINEKNLGMIGSINKGITLFSDKVEWCTILSDDDLLETEFIDKLFKAAITWGAKTIIHSHRIFIDEQGNKIREALLAPQEETALDYFSMRARSKRETYLTGVLFNRKAFNEINGYPVFSTGLATDDALIFALSLKDRLFFERTVCAFIRIHKEAESVSSKEGVKKIQTIKEFGDYCKHAVADLGNFTPTQLKSFYRVLRGYIKDLNSYWWLKYVHSIMDQKNLDVSKELQLLSDLVLQDSCAFSRRIRYSILLEKITGVNPEAYKIYRYLWHQAWRIAPTLRA